MNCVYVGNLPPDIRIKDIDDFFKPFGRLVYIDVKHSDNQRIAYAYVQFEDCRNAFNAVKARHGYDYEGYTLQLRLMENEVRNRRNGTPPFDNYDRPNNNFGMNGNYGGNNNTMVENFSNSNTNGSWSNNRGNDLQQKMIEYPTSNRSNFLQENLGFNVNNRFNMQANMNENYSDTNRSGMLQQNLNYPNRSEMATQNMNFPQCSDMSQQNMMNYLNVNRNMGQPNMMNFSDTNRFNIPQQGITDYSNYSKMPEQLNMMGNNSNNSWSNGNNFGNWDSGNRGNRNFNDECNQIFNQSDMPMNEYELRRLSGAGRKWYRRYIENGMPHKEALAKALDRRTVPYFRGDNADNTSWNGDYNEKINESDEFDMLGLSGAGRKWYKRYLEQGMSPVVARHKALERRQLPYLRGDDPKKNQQSNVPTNVTLENIGNTIMSLLSTNSVGNSNSMDLGNKGIQRPRSVDIQKTVQTTHNAVSDSQYYKSLAALRKLGSKRTLSADDRLTKRYHLQIVKDFRIARKSLNSKSTQVNTIENIRDSEVIAELMRNTKKKLLSQARRLDDDKNPKKRFGGAQKKRFKMLVDMGFPSIEASALAILTTETLRPLLDLKKEYNLSTKKTDFLQGDKISPDIPKIVVYNNDLRYIKQYKNEKLMNLSMRIRIALRKCVIRVHNYERENKLNLTQSKFIFSILNDKYNANNKEKEKKKRNRSHSKKYTENKNSASTTTAVEKVVDDTKAKIENENENCATDSKNTDEDIDDNQGNKDITEEDQDDDDCYVVENPENENEDHNDDNQGQNNDIEIKSE